MAGQIKRRNRLRWILYVLGSFVALISAIGATYEKIEESREDSDDVPPGRLLDVSGHKMHLNCSGRGSPTVVLLGHRQGHSHQQLLPSHYLKLVIGLARFPLVILSHGGSLL